MMLAAFPEERLSVSPLSDRRSCTLNFSRLFATARNNAAFPPRAGARVVDDFRISPFYQNRQICQFFPQRY